MRITVDIMHPAHLNFFKNSIMQLSEEGHQIDVIVLNRGKLPEIAKREYNSFSITVMGRHRGNFFSILLEANILKFFKLLKFVYNKKVDIGLSVGSFILGGALKVFGLPNIQFDDDPERKINVILEKITSTKLLFPASVLRGRKIDNFYGLKEWAYLSPKYFEPKIETLTELGLREKEYIFVREVDTGSLNYVGQEKNIIASVANLLPQNYKYVLSLENKKMLSQYPSNWMVLQEPVSDIHSLMYFSLAVISSGDSMAREGAMLGVPSVYCGERVMKANELLQNKKLLYHIKKNELPKFINNLNRTEVLTHQNKIREELLKEWDDINHLIVLLVKEYGKRGN
ncbi:MAG: DUF354 domain-containing protein [Ignavibacteria bacterium]